MGYEGSADDVASRRGAVAEALEAAGAQPMPEAGEAWESVLPG